MLIKTEKSFKNVIDITKKKSYTLRITKKKVLNNWYLFRTYINIL